MGESTPQFLKLMKVAAQWCPRIVGLAVKAVRGGVDETQIGVRVTDRATVVLDSALRIVDLVDQAGCAARDKTFDEILVIDAPLREIADQQWARGRLRGKQRERRCQCKDRGEKWT